ncbi:hypothetical protein PGB90_000326 [Kerria lacca]
MIAILKVVDNFVYELRTEKRGRKGKVDGREGARTDIEMSWMVIGEEKDVWIIEEDFVDLVTARVIRKRAPGLNVGIKVTTNQEWGGELEKQIGDFILVKRLVRGDVYIADGERGVMK